MLTSRRRFVSAIGFGGIMLPTLVRATALPQTPEEVLGPFYPISRPLDQDADLTMVADKNARATGEVIELSGRALYADGTPAEGVVLDLWQANAVGRYANPLDGSPLPLDPNFQGSAKVMTGKDGQWRITTIKPGAYDIGGGQFRTRHIHWQVDSPHGRLATQSYFPGEAKNEGDILLGPRIARGEDVTGIIAKETGKRADGIARFNWDIILAKPA